ncbi:MAG: hypothetical protein PHG23_03310 [Candidatus Pacebacteria bacterium]|nr:hypothetical protein [Candidatus Paceibacterota bacterium]
MNKFLKIFLVFVAVIFIASFFWFDYFFWAENNRAFVSALENAAQESDVIIIFNSGGFGTVPLDRAYDFKPIIDGTQNFVERLNYKVSVVPYYRTTDSLIGKAAYFKEVLFNFPKESSYLAGELQKFSQANPQKTIIMEGLSNGATFVNVTMKKIECCRDRILAIEFGLPFWSSKDNKSNVLILTNNGGDAVSQLGGLPQLFGAMVRAPFVMIYTKIIGKPISYPEAMSVNGHQYSWMQVQPQVVGFLDRELVNN